MSAAIAAADCLLSPEDAAQLLGLSAYTVRQLARDRRIPAYPTRTVLALPSFVA